MNTKTKKFFGILASLLLLAPPVFAQSVQQSGSVTPNTAAIWSGTGIIKGGVSATDSPLTTFGVTRDAADGICVSSARSTAAGRNQLCLQASTSGAAKISLQNYGTATAQDLQFVINGTAVTIPTGGTNFVQATGTLVSGHMPCWSGTSGLVVDCGVGAGAGTQYGLAYYSAAGTIGSTAAATAGQFVVGQTSSAPLWKTLSGDVASVTAAGALTLNKVNGVSFANTYTAHGVLIAQGTSAFSSSVTNNTGYCLLSQGLSSDPIWAACASGSGSAGGLNTQVQFNNSTSLGGSVNLTWVSPALTIGVAGTTTGQLALASIGGASGIVTLQAPTATAAYNFNFPTGAGSLGQPLISGGGGATANTFGTLGIVGGGTNCASASGTCLDNITSFSSTGYLNRTGSGTYAFSTVIPVSGGGTNLASGTSGGILGYTASGTLASSALLTQYGLVYGGGAGATPVATAAGTNGQIPVATTSAAPTFVTLSGDITSVSAAGLVTIANSAISNAKLANAAAYTLKGNFTGSSAAPQDSTIGALTQKASPAAGDFVILQDNAAAGALKYATVSSIASAGSVSSIAGNTGAFTLGTGLSNTVNSLINTGFVVAKIQTFTASGTYTPSTGLVYAQIECWGGGGGGGGTATAAASTGSGGTGGGAGGYSLKISSAIAVGASQVVTIGAAGAAGTSGNNAGGAGGDTSVGSLCVGKGGSGGGGSSGSGSVTVGAGGVAGTGDVAGTGQPGGGSPAISGAQGYGGYGGTGSPVGGGAAPVMTATTAAGNAATGRASGGGGGASFNGNGAAAGGLGTAGYIKIIEYTNQ